METVLRNIAFLTNDRLEKWQYSVIEYLSGKSNKKDIKILECAFCEKPKIDLITRTHLNLDRLLYKNYQDATGCVTKDFGKANENLPKRTHQRITSTAQFSMAIEFLVSDGVEHIVDFTNSDLIQTDINRFSGLTLWQLIFGHAYPKCSALVGYEEIIHHDTEINVFVVRSTAETKYRIQRQACYKLFPASLSKTRNYLLWRAANLLSDSIANSLETNSQSIEPRTRPTISKLPSYCLGMLKLAWRKKFMKAHWTLGFSKTDILPDSMAPFRELEQPDDRFWADPFIVRQGDRIHVFIEELEYSKGKGDLAHFTIEKDGTPSKCVKILEKDYHLSYPFVFEVENTFYMIPETSENRTIDLYRCEAFPEKWVFEKTLMRDIVAADTTLFYHDSRWWMFTTLDNGLRGSNDDELFLYYADTHNSDTWTPHPMNPIIRDVRSARPAGKVFIDRRKRIIRPSQDCSAFYGRGLNLNEIEILSTTEYRERRINRIDATDHDSSDGVHTYNSDSSVSIIDQFRWTR